MSIDSICCRRPVSHGDALPEKDNFVRGDTIQFGTHATVDGYGGSPEALRSFDRVRDILNDLPRKLGMKVIADPVVVQVGPHNEKDSGGLSGFVRSLKAIFLSTRFLIAGSSVPMFIPVRIRSKSIQ